MLAILNIRFRATKVNEMHGGFFEIEIFEHVLILMLFLNTRQLLSGLKINHGHQVSQAIAVVSIIVSTEHNVVCLDVKMHIT